MNTTAKIINNKKDNIALIICNTEENKKDIAVLIILKTVLKATKIKCITLIMI